MKRRNIFLISMCAYAAPLLFATPGTGTFVDPSDLNRHQECEEAWVQDSHQLEPEDDADVANAEDTWIVSTPRSTQAHARSLAPSGTWMIHYCPAVTIHHGLRMVRGRNTTVAYEAAYTLKQRSERQQNADRRRGETYDGFT